MNEILEIAILAYRAGRYPDAVELLQHITDADASNAAARLYLGMAYQKLGKIGDAQRLFQRLSTHCNDETVRRKAQYALPLVEAQLKREYDNERERLERGKTLTAALNMA
jgi:thioredoxin-like negative regulator of GroEL